MSLEEFPDKFTREVADYLHDQGCHGEHVERCGYHYATWKAVSPTVIPYEYWEKKRCYANASSLIKSYGIRSILDYFDMEVDFQLTGDRYREKHYKLYLEGKENK